MTTKSASVTTSINPLLGIIAVFFSALLFSAKAVMIKLAFRYPVDPVSLLCLRMVFSLPFFVGVALYVNRKTWLPKLPLLGRELGGVTEKTNLAENAESESQSRLTFTDYGKLAGLGILGYYAASILDFWGLQYVSAGLERLILFVYPTLVVVISWSVFKKPIGRTEVFALVLTYAGMLVVFSGQSFLKQTNIWMGAFLIFGSALTYAIYLVGSGRMIPRFGAVRFNAYAMIVSSFAVILHYLISYPESLWHFPAQVYYYGMALAIFSTVIPTFLVTAGIKIIGAGRAAIVASIGPVSTIVLGYFFLNETVELREGIGTVLVLAGVLLVSTKK
ncbi:DMT family transporter [Cytophagaceae bacterium DM2B3-1]|uniref:DMT family transporter n=1 Tax=Xanthocytophaga flava TaxID=3048013 RepID=A0ABT7CT30_9BACT|nr:DMT family transporter [Xanthocytophaga flavus]MDJ1471967.1 DMT family transporter [Xanthocytophaga flavus]MDJ1496904.1 DMT family transporter [Xanthocytophaga flavus]